MRAEPPAHTSGLKQPRWGFSGQLYDKVLYHLAMRELSMINKDESEQNFESLVERVRAPRTGEIIASNLRKLIVRGELRPGTRLPPESKLTAQLGISTPTLREALRILEADSLIIIRRGAGGGPEVCVPSPEVSARHFGLVLQSKGATLLDVFRIRQLIEPPAVRLVVMQTNKVVSPLLSDLVRQEWGAFEKQDINLLSHYMARFHDQLIEETGNKTLSIMMHMLNDVYEKHVTLELLGSDMNDKKLRATQLSIKSHEKLLGLIQAGDSKTAVAYWVDHLERVRKVLFKYHEAIEVIDVLG